MKISYNWLKEFVDIEFPPRELAAKLTMAGLAVDAVEECGDDHVLDIDLTSNRPDCLSHLGVAREVAAIIGRTLKTPKIKIIESKKKTSEETSVEILNPEFCPRYTARLIKGVRIGPSPDWLVKRLEVMGQRSVNNVADITNYVMLEFGQPLHAFDFDRLRGKRIIVRAARPGEKITTLDREERDLTPEMLVIADAERAVALGGIKGGEDSGITESTTDVLLEAAYFTPAQIRKTSKALGLSTEASYRFERGADPEIVPVASDRAAAMIAEIAGGEVLGELVDAYPGADSLRSSRKPISFRAARYTALTGLSVSLSEAKKILQSLGFEPGAKAEKGSLVAFAPSWRIDASIEEDLIEEVARISGYDQVKTTLPGNAGAGAYLEGEETRRTVRRSLTALGYHEAVSFSFVNAETDAALSGYGDHARLKLLNPIDETQSHMRTTLLGGLLNALERNFNHGMKNVRLFEIGKCFLASSGERPLEEERLALVATGARNEFDWRTGAERLDFYDVKGAIESIAEILNLPGLSFAATDKIGYLHPGRAAVISIGGKNSGRLGQLHPALAANFKFKQPVFCAELSLSALLEAGKAESRYQPLPKFPTVVRDLALLIDTNVEFAAIEAAIGKLNIPEMVGMHIFDLYTGKELPAGKHSMALSFRYRAADRTLTDEEINAMHSKAAATLTETFGAELR